MLLSQLPQRKTGLFVTSVSAGIQVKPGRGSAEAGMFSIIKMRNPVAAMETTRRRGCWKWPGFADWSYDAFLKTSTVEFWMVKLN